MNSKSMFNSSFRPTEIVKINASIFAIPVNVKVATSAIFQLVMFFSLHHYQVAGTVVGSIPINVMNNFVTFKRSAYHLFRHEAVFVQVGFASFGNYLVAATRYVTTFPVGMFIAIKSANSSLRDRQFSELSKPSIAQCAMPKRLVLGSGHVVESDKVTFGNLLSAIVTANSALNIVIRHVFSFQKENYMHGLYSKIVNIAM